MKKIVTLVLVLLLVPGMSVGKEAEVPAGILTKLGVSEETLNVDLAEKDLALLPFTTFKYFDTLNSMLAALNSGRIVAFEIDEYTVNYLLSRTDRYTVFRPSRQRVYNLNFSMLLREEDGQLRGLISSAIADMKADGTLDALKKKYIDDCITGSDPKAVKPEHFEGAATFKIALTGDRPPMDYISVAGEPIGFNTALVSEIAKRLKMNTEFISINSGARAAALASKACDVVFWSESGDFDNREGFETEDLPEHAITTTPYLSSSFVWITLSSSPLLQK